MEARALQGLIAVAIWLPVLILYRVLGSPAALRLVIPLPSLILVADALGPRPCLVRWGSRRWRRAGYLCAAGLSGIALAGIIAAFTSPLPTTDQPATLLCGSRDLLRGRIPYLTYEPQCFRQLHDSSLAVTPLDAGPFANSGHPPSLSLIRDVLRRDQRTDTHAGFPAFGYPPDAALLTIPVAFSGWMAMTAWVLGVSSLLFLTLWARPTAARPLLMAWQFTAVALLLISFKGNPEDLSYLLLALALAYLDSPRISAVLMAAAICTNPLSWPIAPVYCAIVLHEPARGRRLRWLAASIFIGTAPWLIWDHQLLTQLWRFATMPVFPAGSALGSYLPLSGVFRAICTLAFATVALTIAYAGWRWPRWRWSATALVWVAFLLAWKGPEYYFLPALWLGPSVVTAAYRSACAEAARRVQASRFPLSLPNVHSN